MNQENQDCRVFLFLCNCVVVQCCLLKVPDKSLSKVNNGRLFYLEFPKIRLYIRNFFIIKRKLQTLKKYKFAKFFFNHAEANNCVYLHTLKFEADVKSFLCLKILSFQSKLCCILYSTVSIQ